jgi:hypothetical protein
VRERKRSKGKIKNQGISINEASPGSAEQPKKKVHNFLIAFCFFYFFRDGFCFFLLETHVLMFIVRD